MGAIRNAELQKLYFPSWICRFYVNNIPGDVTKSLSDLGAEIIEVEEMSMLSRFMVAADEKVDRYIVRDVDSHLNARDRYHVIASACVNAIKVYYINKLCRIVCLPPTLDT